MLNEELLEDRLGALEAAKAWSPRIISRLEALLRSGSEEALFRINPIKFAADRSIAETEAIDLFLHASLVGLFEMDWLLVCPSCSDVVESFRSLRSLHGHYHCSICQSDYTAVLDDYILVTFTVTAQVRPIRFHHPADLAVGEYAFIYRASPEGMTQDGVPWVEVIKSLTKVLTFLPAQTTTRLEFECGEGLLYGWDIDSDAHFYFPISAAAPRSDQPLRVIYRAGRCEPDAGEIAAGRMVLEVENVTDRRGFIGIIVLPPGPAERPVLRFAPYLSAKRLLTTQTFRDFFRSEVIRATEGLAVKEISLLFTDLKGSTALYDRIGDLNAYAQVQRHFERLLDVTVRHRGAVIKTIGDAVMAAFLTPADAVNAALEMRRAVDHLNHGRPQRDFILKIGIHTGASIAVTLNEHLDYFGQTVNIAARIQNLAEGDEICISEDVYAAPGVRDILAPFATARTIAELKGVNEKMGVYRIASTQAA